MQDPPVLPGSLGHLSTFPFVGLTSDDVRLIDEVNVGEGVRWLFSFLSADRRRTYCLYEAPSPDAIMAAAREANLPADAVVEVGPATTELSGRLRDWAAAQPGG